MPTAKHVSSTSGAYAPIASNVIDITTRQPRHSGSLSPARRRELLRRVQRHIRKASVIVERLKAQMGGGS